MIKNRMHFDLYQAIRGLLPPWRLTPDSQAVKLKQRPVIYEVNVRYQTLTRLMLLGTALTLGGLGWSQRGGLQAFLQKRQAIQAVYAQIEEHTRQLRDSPQDALLWYNRGVLRAQTAGLEQAALADLKRAHQLEPEDPETLYNLAWLELRLGQNPAALKHLTRLLQIDPYHLDGRWNRAWLQQQLKNPQAAQQDYRFIQKKLSKKLSPLEKAQLAALLNRPKEAAEAYAQALKKSPGQLDALLGRARSLVVLQQFAAAEPILAEAFKQPLSPEQRAELLKLRAEVALSQKKPDSALKDYLSLLQLQPQNARLQLQIAGLLAQAGQEGQAVNYLTQALKRAPALKQDPLLQERAFARLRRLPELQGLLKASAPPRQSL